MAQLKFAGNALAEIRKFPESARRDTGYQLSQVQLGFDPTDWRSMSSIGTGVREIRIHKDGEFRVIYISRFHDVVYVLHAFQKKSQKTLKKDIDLAKARLKLIQEIKS